MATKVATRHVCQQKREENIYIFFIVRRNFFQLPFSKFLQTEKLCVYDRDVGFDSFAFRVVIASLKIKFRRIALRNRVLEASLN